uniref:Uncharacterized protein n=1 Tax=Rangifer tarandus platyrhynchus TaxID=3082113 RepID=A0ACB0FH66_RANTA|nr:unnamed protein product [Rangifer tarandus platyrhynchus]
MWAYFSGAGFPGPRVSWSPEELVGHPERGLNSWAPELPGPFGGRPQALVRGWGSAAQSPDLLLRASGAFPGRGGGGLAQGAVTRPRSGDAAPERRRGPGAAARPRSGGPAPERRPGPRAVGGGFTEGAGLSHWPGRAQEDGAGHLQATECRVAPRHPQSCSCSLGPLAFQ